MLILPLLLPSAPVVPLSLYVCHCKLASPGLWEIISVVWLEIRPPFMIAPNAEAISLLLLFGELAPPSMKFSKAKLVTSDENEVHISDLEYFSFCGSRSCLICV